MEVATCTVEVVRISITEQNYHIKFVQLNKCLHKLTDDLYN